MHIIDKAALGTNDIPIPHSDIASMMEGLGEHDHPAHDEEPIAAQGTDNADASPAGDASESKDGMELAVQKGDADILDKDVSTLP